jgi:hypothetical protein
VGEGIYSSLRSLDEEFSPGMKADLPQQIGSVMRGCYGLGRCKAADW